MAVSDDLVLEAARRILAVPGLQMDPDGLLEDSYLLALAFPDEGDFAAAVAATVRALGDLCARRVSSSSLKHALGGWSSYHYQHKVAQGARADCRVVFHEAPDGIVVLGFGHRRIPEDIYSRMAAGR